MNQVLSESKFSKFFKSVLLCVIIFSGLNITNIFCMHSVVTGPQIPGKAESIIEREVTYKEIKTKDIGEVLSNVALGENRGNQDNETIVIFDVDGVVMIPIVLLGCDTWAFYEWGKYFDKYVAEDKEKIAAYLEKHNYGLFKGEAPRYKNVPEDVFKMATKDADAKAWADYRIIWPFVQNNVEVRMVEEKFMDVLDKLYKNGIKIMGFTARGMNLVDRTKYQMDSLKKSDSFVPAKVDISSFTGEEEIDSVGKYFVANAYCPQKIETPDYTNKDGVLFVNMGVNKGETLKKLFEKIGKRPGKIVFVDDAERNIKAMGQMCKREGISYIGILYDGAEDFVRLDYRRKKICDMQLEHLLKTGKVLSNEQAGKMISKD